jgi:DNA-binding IscR family transcriptional regulator
MANPGLDKKPAARHLGMQSVIYEVASIIQTVEAEGGAPLAVSVIAASSGISSERARFLLARLEETGIVTSENGEYSFVTGVVTP